MKTCRQATLFIAVIALTASAADAQQAGPHGGGGGRGAILVSPGEGFKITESAPIEVTPVKNAPFSAQAVTEFAQTLGDGNRIERRYESSVARDSRGRARREEEVALIGPLAAGHAATPRLVTIVDPDSGASYTLDDERRVAYRNVRASGKKLVELEKLEKALRRSEAGTTNGGGGRGTPADVQNAEIERTKINAAGDVTVQDLGIRSIEGVRTQGTRTTTTIAAGAIGNLQPINIVSERWFSPELQMPVLVTRRDPRNGDTTYRLTHIQRGEQPDALFTVPSWYEVKDGDLKFRLVETLVEKAKGKIVKVEEPKR
ncbi:MAG: hypothetical protein ACRD3G_22695 [Vicinamibacterales bacterium]